MVDKNQDKQIKGTYTKATFIEKLEEEFSQSFEENNEDPSVFIKGRYNTKDFGKNPFKYLSEIFDVPNQALNGSEIADRLHDRYGIERVSAYTTLETSKALKIRNNQRLSQLLNPGLEAISDEGGWLYKLSKPGSAFNRTQDSEYKR